LMQTESRTADVNNRPRDGYEGKPLSTGKSDLSDDETILQLKIEST